MSNYYDVVDIAPGIKRINSSENAACDLIIGTKKAALIPVWDWEICLHW